MIEFGKRIKRIRKEVKKNITKKGNIYDKEKIISIIIYLLDHCKFRIGSEEYKKLYNTYGATTINRDHIIFKEDEVEIKFIGKKSVENTAVIKNKETIELLKELCKKYKGKESIFYYKDKTDTIRQVNSQMVTAYLKKYHNNLIPKMFRTWNGNNILLKYLISQEKPQNEKEIKKNLREAIKRVAKELHNTISVAKKSYLNSEIYTTYLMDNQKFYNFLENNKKENGDKKTTDRILTLFLIEYYKDI